MSEKIVRQPMIQNNLLLALDEKISWPKHGRSKAKRNLARIRAQGPNHGKNCE